MVCFQTQNQMCFCNIWPAWLWLGYSPCQPPSPHRPANNGDVRLVVSCAVRLLRFLFLHFCSVHICSFLCLLFCLPTLRFLWEIVWRHDLDEGFRCQYRFLVIYITHPKSLSESLLDAINYPFDDRLGVNPTCCIYFPCLCWFISSSAKQHLTKACARMYQIRPHLCNAKQRHQKTLVYAFGCFLRVFVAFEQI